MKRANTNLGMAAMVLAGMCMLTAPAAAGKEPIDTGTGGGGFKATDINRSGKVDWQDALEVLANWGAKGSRADVNGDGIVGFADLIAVYADMD